MLYQFNWPDFTGIIKTSAKPVKYAGIWIQGGKHLKAFLQPTDLSSGSFQKIVHGLSGPIKYEGKLVYFVFSPEDTIIQVHLWCDIGSVKIVGIDQVLTTPCNSLANRVCNNFHCKFSL